MRSSNNTSPPLQRRLWTRSSVVEQRAFNPTVVGSTPTESSTLYSPFLESVKARYLLGVIDINEAVEICALELGPALSFQILAATLNTPEEEIIGVYLTFHMTKT
jgi:hypothetical protein